MDWLDWLILGLVTTGAIAFLVWKIIAIVKMPKEEREELIKKWLMSAIVMAESTIKEKGAGKEKLQMVIAEFETTAPFIYKFLIKITDGLDLEEIINNALQTIKENFEK